MRFYKQETKLTLIFMYSDKDTFKSVSLYANGKLNSLVPKKTDFHHVESVSELLTIIGFFPLFLFMDGNNLSIHY